MSTVTNEDTRLKRLRELGLNKKQSFIIKQQSIEGEDLDYQDSDNGEAPKYQE